MFVNFSEETQHLLKQAEKEKDSLNHPYVGSEHLFLAILKEKHKINDILRKNGVTYEAFKNEIMTTIGMGTKKSTYNLYTPLLKKVLENALIDAREENNKSVNPEVLIISLLDYDDSIAYNILSNMGIDIEKLYYDIKNNKPKKAGKKKLMLEELGTNLTKLARENKLDPVIGRDKELNEMIEILLRRKKNNPILIGPAGVGKTAIVEALATLIAQNKVPLSLLNKKIISLNIFSLVAGTKYRGEFEEKMKQIIKELEENDDIIIFIDEIHTMVGAGGAEGAIDASNIFKPALARGTIKMIGATTLDEYKKYIEPDAALSRRFEKVNVEEPSDADVLRILNDIKTLYEKHHNVKISSDVIASIANLSKKYILDKYEPDRSIDVLDEACCKASISKNSNDALKDTLRRKIINIKSAKKDAVKNNDFKKAYLLKKEELSYFDKLKALKDKVKDVSINDVISVIKTKSNVPVVGLSYEEDDYYDELYQKLHKSVVGKEDIIEKLILSLKRKNLVCENGSYGVLISGPKGSGKTFLAGVYAKTLVGEKNVIEQDMSFFNEPHTISKLLGTTAGYLGYDNKNNVFEKVRTNPYSALVLENIDLCCDDVMNLIIRILEKGKIEDAKGVMIDFSNASIIMITSSSEVSNVGFTSNQVLKKETIPNKLVASSDLFINLKAPNKESVQEIIKDKLKEINKRHKKSVIDVNDLTINKIINDLPKDFDLSKLDQIIKNYVEEKIVKTLSLNTKTSKVIN